MLKVLKNSFKDFKFFEDGHYYECKGKRVGVSVTTFIHEYCNEFDELGMAEKSAIKNNKSVQEILDEWHYKRDFSCEKGTDGHNYSQHLWSGNKYEILKFDMSDEYYQSIFKIHRQAENFYRDYKERLEHLFDELPIGSEEFNIASCCDHLFYNKLTGGLVLVDYKTNTDIYKDKKYYENSRKKPSKMKIPLQHLEDLTITHYYIQLSIYKFLIEKYTGLKVDEMFIVYMSENIKNYEIIEIPYLKKEVKEILENRRVKNMKSVPVLLIGKSGSGKSASLRNFKKDEIAIANVLGKPLPFKSDLEAPKVDDYNTILKAIEHTNKKVIVIDDANYLLSNATFRDALIKGYEKFTIQAKNYYDLIEASLNLRDNLTIVFISHIENCGTDMDPQWRLYTTGKMLTNAVNLDGLFSYLLYTERYINDGEDEVKYRIKTKTDGNDTCRSVAGCFDSKYIEPNMADIIKRINEFEGVED